jgi:dihydroflavonol-4-reductase
LNKNVNNILITGATGFIGSKLAEYYIRKEKNVNLFVRDPSKVDPLIKKSCHIETGDITRLETLNNTFKNIDAAIHCAGMMGHWGNTYQQLYDVNVEGSLNIIKAAYNAGVKRLIHLSAGGVTGPVGPDIADESFPPAPFTAYEQTKWKAEQEVLGFAQKKNLNLLVIRPTFTYGPGDPHKLDLFKAVKKKMLVFIGNGNSTVHPVYIDDLVKGINLGMASDLKQKSIIIGGESPVTIKEFLYGMADALGVSRPVIKLPITVAQIIAIVCEISAAVLKFNPPLTRSRVLALSRNWGYSINRARTELGYEPQVNLPEGLKRTVTWYLEKGWL